METWIWISLWVVQTILGAVFYRKYFNVKGNVGESPEDCLFMSAVVIVNCISLVFILFYGIGYLFKQILIFIDFLAGIKKTEEK
jgi:hypothetical protein